MSKAVYLALRWKQPIDEEAFWALERWRLAQSTGWSLDYIDTLDLATWQEFWSVRGGEIDAIASLKAKTE